MALLDWKSIILAKHAQHVVLVHFPIALFVTGTMLDLAFERSKNRSLEAAVRCNLLIAALSTVPVLLSGFGAWYWALEGARFKGILLQHLVLALASSLLIILTGWIHLRSMRSGDPAPRIRLLLEVIATFLIAFTGHLGGTLSGVNQ